MTLPRIHKFIILMALASLMIVLSACTSSGRCDQSKKEPRLTVVPIYPEATVIATGLAPNPDYNQTQLSTTADPSEVLQFYREALALEGWEIDPDKQSDMEVRGGYGNCCHYGSVSVSLNQPAPEKGQRYTLSVYVQNRWYLCM